MTRLSLVLAVLFAVACGEPEVDLDPSQAGEVLVIVGGGPGRVCGAGLCPLGQVCCNPSCGICAPPGKTCMGERCDARIAGCMVDADCHAVVNQCGRCRCELVDGDAPIPACTEGIFKCPRNPCQGRVPRCERATGTCTMRGLTEPIS